MTILLQTVRSVSHISLQITERMIETPEDLVGGMKVVLSLFRNAKGIFGCGR